MTFDIETIAKKYVAERFPKASFPEQEKIISDWKGKLVASEALVRDFSARVGNPKAKTILDAGSGNGGISIAFARAGAIPTGIDIEGDLYAIAISHAKELNADAKFVLYDGNIMPFEDNTFDYAVSASVLEHTDDPALYLNEILRVVKPGGSLYLGFPNKLRPKETHTGTWFLTWMPKTFRPKVLKWLKRNPLEANNLHFYGFRDLERMIRNSTGSYRWVIVSETGKSSGGVKKIIKKILGFFGIHYKMFLPHILVILKKEKIS